MQKEIEKIIENDDVGKLEIKIKENIGLLDIFIKDDQGTYNLLQYAVKKSAVNIAIYLIPFYKEKNALNYRISKGNGYSGESALHFAIKNDLIEIVKVLLAAGSDPNGLGDFQWPALIYAIYLGKVPIAKCLLESPNIDVNQQVIRENKINSCSALWWACYKGYNELIPLLFKKRAKILFISSREMLGYEMRGEYSGLSPLHVASKHGHSSIVRYFCVSTYTCDKAHIIDNQNEAGNTPLHLAANFESAKILIEVGKANLHLQNKKTLVVQGVFF